MTLLDLDMKKPLNLFVVIFFLINSRKTDDKQNLTFNELIEKKVKYILVLIKHLTRNLM